MLAKKSSKSIQFFHLAYPHRFVGFVLICKISRPRATAHRCTKIYTDYLFPPSALSVESASLYYLTLISLIPQIFCAALARARIVNYELNQCLSVRSVLSVVLISKESRSKGVLLTSLVEKLSIINCQLSIKSVSFCVTSSVLV